MDRRGFIAVLGGVAVVAPRHVAREVPVEGAIGDGVADDTAAIQAALDAAATAGGGAVHLPAGRYRLTSPLRPASFVTLTGDGAATVLAPAGRVSAIAAAFTSDAPLTAFHCRDLAIDGRDQVGPYTSATKGIFITHLSGCTFTNLLVSATAATGIGIDYLYDGTVVRDCRVVGCGRLNGGSLPGGAGIGIGTGGRDLESFLVTGNHCAGNARFGIFVESQSTRPSTGGRIVANTCERNRHGIGDCGTAATIVLGNTCVGNSGSGVVVDTGTLSPIVSREGQVAANVSSGNGEHGVLIDLSLGAAGTGYVVRGNRCERNGKAGVKLVSNATRAIAGVTVVDNDIHANGSLGVHVSTTGAHATDLTISGNRCAGNGLTNNAGFTQGIRLDAPTDRFTVTDNVCWDDAGRQTYGIQLTAGATFVDGHIAGNHVSGNTQGGLRLAGVLVACRVTDNHGHEAAGVVPLVTGPSPWTYTAGAAPEVLYLAGGSVGAVVKGGAQVAATTPATVVLRPNEQVTVTYSSPPTAVVDRG